MFYLSFQGGTSFVDHLCYLWLVFVMLSRLFIAALWSLEGKWLTTWLLFVLFIVILLLSHFVSLDRCVSIPDPCCLSYFEGALLETFRFVLNYFNFWAVTK